MVLVVFVRRGPWSIVVPGLGLAALVAISTVLCIPLQGVPVVCSCGRSCCTQDSGFYRPGGIYLHNRGMSVWSESFGQWGVAFGWPGLWCPAGYRWPLLLVAFLQSLELGICQ